MAKDFINRENLIECVKNVYLEEAKSWNKYYDNYIDEDLLQEVCEEEALRIGNNLADDFNRYFLSKDYTIVGNFAHVEINWESDVKWGNIPEQFAIKHFDDVYKGLVDGTLGEDFEKFFKDWAVEWFFWAFGTYNLGYNFGETLDNIFYEEISEYEEMHETA